MDKPNPRLVIIGAGPCGIGAGWYLNKQGYDNWVIYKGNDHPGGLSASFIDETGFVWDMGGHVVFSNYREFSGFLGKVLGKINDFLEPQNIFSRGRFGSFSYEKGNMDDCFMQGLGIVKKIMD